MREHRPQLPAFGSIRVFRISRLIISFFAFSVNDNGACLRYTFSQQITPLSDISSKTSSGMLFSGKVIKIFFNNFSLSTISISGDSYLNSSSLSSVLNLKENTPSFIASPFLIGTSPQLESIILLFTEISFLLCLIPFKDLIAQVLLGKAI